MANEIDFFLPDEATIFISINYCQFILKCNQSSDFNEITIL